MSENVKVSSVEPVFIQRSCVASAERKHMSPFVWLLWIPDSLRKLAACVTFDKRGKSPVRM